MKQTLENSSNKTLGKKVVLEKNDITELKAIAKIIAIMKANSLKVKILYIIFLAIMFLSKSKGLGFCVFMTVIFVIWNAYYLILCKGYENWYDEIKRRRLELDYRDHFAIKPYYERLVLVNFLCPTIWGFYGVIIIAFAIAVS